MSDGAQRTAFEELVHVMVHLRSPGGCPWDRQQDHETLKPFLLEEAYEVLDAIDAGDDAELCAELGDVLLQVVFHAQVASEAGRFDADDVCRAIVDKLVRRHPHVFGDVAVADADHVVRNWEAIKRAERGADGAAAPSSALDGVPRALPALLRAQRVQEKAARVGFDWDRVDGPLDKVGEELEELRREWAQGDGADPARVAEEFGDLLFALVNAARFLRVAPEDALRKAVDKFSSRFRRIEAVLRARGRNLADASLAEMDAVWQEVKAGA